MTTTKTYRSTVEAYIKSLSTQEPTLLVTVALARGDIDALIEYTGELSSRVAAEAKRAARVVQEGEKATAVDRLIHAARAAGVIGDDVAVYAAPKNLQPGAQIIRFDMNGGPSTVVGVVAETASGPTITRA